MKSAQLLKKYKSADMRSEESSWSAKSRVPQQNHDSKIQVKTSSVDFHDIWAFSK